MINDSNKIILEQDIKDMICGVKSNVYFDFFSRFFCGVDFKARQTKGSDLTSIHSATPLQLLLGSFCFDKLALSALPYGTMCWPMESKFVLSSTNKMSFSIGLLQLLARISLIDTKIEIV